jgi:urease accessory protein
VNAVVDNDTWHAALKLRFARRGDETLLLDRSHRGPLRVQRPFYPESKRVCHVYLLHPPGGLVSGDRLNIDISVDSRAWGLLTTPGAGKFYRSDGRRSVSQSQHLNIADGGVLEWLPQENILYDGTRAETLTRVNLQASARFIGWEISCLGRPASGERLRNCQLRQRFELWRDDLPLWLERSRYGDHSSLMEGAWGLRGCTVVGTLVCTSGDTALLEAVREQVSVGTDALFSASQLDEVLVCRYLGDQAQEARAALVQAWRVLRPAVLGADAAPPRIWNT